MGPLEALALGTVGLCGAVLSHVHRHEKRYLAIYVLLMMAAAYRCTGRFSLAGHCQSASLLLNLYSVDGDDYNLIFFQIHFLACWYVTAHFSYLTEFHMAAVAVATIWQLRVKICKQQEVADQANACVRWAIALALFAGSTLFRHDGRWIGPIWRGEEKQFLVPAGHMAAAGALWASVLCSQLLRCAEKRAGPAKLHLCMNLIPCVGTLDKQHYL